jgi:hypothetical protein
MFSSRKQVLSLYRAALRVCHVFPVPSLRRKLKYNVRDLFDLYRYETQPKQIDILVNNGKADLEFLASFKQLNDTTLKRLFKERDIRVKV